MTLNQIMYRLRLLGLALHALLVAVSLWVVVGPITPILEPGIYETVHEYPTAVVWLLGLALYFTGKDAFWYQTSRALGGASR